MSNINSSKSSVTVKKESERKTVYKRPSSEIKTAIPKTSKEKSGDLLTKEILIKAASEGFSKAAAKTMEVMGYNVIVKDGWVVKKFADGRIEKISKLEGMNRPVLID